MMVYLQYFQVPLIKATPIILEIGPFAKTFDVGLSVDRPLFHSRRGPIL